MLYDTMLVLALVVVAFALIYIPVALLFHVANLRMHPIYRDFMTTWILFVAIGFHVWFWTHGGQTLGMRAWRLKLVSENGWEVSLNQAITRYMVALLSWMALGLGFLWVWIDPQKRAWHDIASRTRLVLVDR